MARPLKVLRPIPPKKLKSNHGKSVTRRPKESPPSGPTFTCFLKLPFELQDMIWDQALTGVCVLRLADADKWGFVGEQGFVGRYLVEPPWIRSGFDPLPVALSCQAAARRWRKLYPWYWGIANPAQGLRLNLDLSLFYNREAVVHHWLSNAVIYQVENGAPQKGGLLPRHMAYHDDLTVKTGSELETLEELGEKDGNAFLANDLRKIFPTCQSVIAVSKDDKRSWPAVVEEISRMLVDPNYRGQCNRNCSCRICKEKKVRCWRLGKFRTERKALYKMSNEIGKIKCGESAPWFDSDSDAESRASDDAIWSELDASGSDYEDED